MGFRSAIGIVMVGVLFVWDAPCRAEVRTVALTGDPAPGTSAGERLGRFENIQINSRGQVAYVARLTDAAGDEIYRHDPDVGFDITPDMGIWWESPTGTFPVLRQGRPVIGHPDGVVSWMIDPGDSDDTLYDYLLSNAGVTATFGTGPNRSTYEARLFPSAAESRFIVRTDDPSGDGATVLSRFGLLEVNDTGQSLFHVSLRRADEEPWSTGISSLWTRLPSGSLVPVFRAGQTPDGAPPGFNFDDLRAANINNTGQIAATIELARFPTPYYSGSDSFQGIYAGTSGADLRPVVIDSYRHPEYGPPVGLGWENRASINIHGAIAYGGGHGVWANDGDTVRAIAVLDEPIQLGAVSGTLANFGGVDLADDGTVAFGAEFVVDDRRTSCLWEETENGLAPVAVPGTRIPGSPGTELLGRQERWSRNAQGQIAFLANMDRPEVTGYEFISAIFAQDRDNNLRLIAHAGDPLEVRPGDWRTIEQLGFAWASDDFINDRGQVAFHAFFTDGTSGVFVSNLVAVPEPGSFLLALLAGGAFIGSVLARRRDVRPTSTAVVCAPYHA